MSAAVNLAILFYCLLLQTVKLSATIQNGWEEIKERKFDFIVVGGGTAGCVVARRLSETGEHSVLLVEQGPFPHPDMEVPFLSVAFRNDPKYTKFISSVPQTNSAQITNGITTFLAGNVLGGSSCLNSMILNRGNPLDYDNWVSSTDDETWGYDHLSKYFKKYENYLALHPNYLRGREGPIPITPSGYAPALENWLAGAQQLGFSIINPNDHQRIGFSITEFTKSKLSRRVSSFHGYILPMLEGRVLGNLSIATESTATKILFDQNKRASAVEISVDSSIITVHARKEIIISAGVMGSPILMQKSGIGPKYWLEKQNIPVIKDLPAGENLQEHVQLSQSIILNRRSGAVDRNKDLTEENYKLFNETGKGPYACTSCSDGQAYLMFPEQEENIIIITKVPRKKIDWPNVVMTTNNVIGVSNQGIGAYNLNPDEVKEDEGRVGWTIALTRPSSRGFVGVVTNETDNSSIFLDFRLLSHQNELQSLVETMKFTEKLCEGTEGFRSLGCRLPKTPLKRCQQFTFRSEEYWECFVKQMSRTGLHAAGTCKMGKSLNDVEAVVDSKLKVIGVTGLRVCDASIMPIVTNANTMGAVYAIAEKAADLILKTWSKPINVNL